MRREGTARLGSALVLLLGLWIIALPGRAMAEAEQWCQNNPAVCVCSKTFQGGAWTRSSTSNWAWSQTGESTATTTCGLLVDGVRVVQQDPGAAAPVQTTGLSGRQATQFRWTMVLEPPSLSGLAGRRVGVRYYHYWDPDYRSTNWGQGDGQAGIEGAVPCNNDKYTQIGDYFTAYVHRFTNSNDGLSLPGGQSPTSMRGKWAIIEQYIQTYGGSPTTHEYYLTDLSTGTTSSMTAPARLSLSSIGGLSTTHIVHKYRSAAEGYGQSACPGAWRVMYAVMASWPAGGRQRIPPATEISGGGTTTPAPSAPPSPPNNLRLLRLAPLPPAAPWQVATASQLSAPITKEALPWGGAALLAPLAAVFYGLRRR
jgi:hypothetical protein